MMFGASGMISCWMRTVSRGLLEHHHLELRTSDYLHESSILVPGGVEAPLALEER